MKKLFILVLLFALILPQMALAQSPCKAGTGSSLGRCITQIYTWSLAISAILGILMIIMGGYKVMTAGGNAEQSTSGKNMVLSSIVGICLLFGAYLILNTINPDLVNFRNFSPGTDPFANPPAQQGTPAPTPDVNP
jgi:hypothetical protein